MIFACDLNSGTLLPFEQSDKKDGRPDGQEVKKATYGAADGTKKPKPTANVVAHTKPTPAISEALTICANSQFAVKTRYAFPGVGTERGHELISS